MKAPLFYGADREYEVEVGDEVEFDGPEMRESGGLLAKSFTPRFKGEVTAAHPRKGTVRIIYKDHWDIAPSTGNPRTKSIKVPVAQVSLVARTW